MYHNQVSGSTMATPSMLTVAFFLFLLVTLSSAQTSNQIGVNYGRLGNNLPSPYHSIESIQNLNAGGIKIYDANPEIMKLLAGTKLHVTIMVTNLEIVNIASNQSVANRWVHENVLAFYPDTMTRYILVGNEVFSYSSPQDRQIWNSVVPAMRRLKTALKNQGIKNIKLGTPVAMDVLQTTFPPSSGRFRPDIANTVIAPLLKFLNGSKSYYFVDVYPYFPWSANPANMSLDFALFNSSITYTDPGTKLTYTNLLDQMLDSHVFAMANLGFTNIKLSISETGWPNAGDIDQPGVNILNAATYNRNLIKRITSASPIGTPARPEDAIPTFLFSLYDENQKPGPGTERHWGLLHPNGSPNYEIDLSGQHDETEYVPLPEAMNNKPYQGKVWCMVAAGADLTQLETALTYACNRGNRTCEALTPGRECYEPLSVIWHATYAFSSYWAQFRKQGATCYFDGLAQQTTRDPSRGACKVPSVTL